ncbi:MAG: hypothetical protein K0U98_15570 [Deltaproteobacteria bacterium]|nr:hypothetical protein [Deltaproteobacteria bacterium]
MRSNTIRPLLLPSLILLLVGSSPADADLPEKASLVPPPVAILASLDFEQPTPSGPDTFRIFEHSTGRVDLSQSFRWSGFRSLRVREEPENGCFSEFLGFFPEQTQGLVFVQFYLLLTDPTERMNFALAGPRWFLNMERGGHALWLETREGSLRHRTGQHWKDLFEPRPFQWYFVDLVYDVDRGRYDLAIYEEGREEPRIDLRQQRNTADTDGSSIAYYSFIGDLEDKGSGTYFVDDVLIASDKSLRQKPFVAPGRRRFFVDSYGDSQELLTEASRADLIAEARRGLLRGELLGDRLAGESAQRLERAADEAFRLRDLDLAEELYDVLRVDPEREGRILLKLSDVYFERGDLESERAAREAIYGRLELEELRPLEALRGKQISPPTSELR